MNLTLGDTRYIINLCKKNDILRNQCAYILATAFHETAHTMKPVREYGGEKYLKSKKYYPYVGMGYVQLTWLDNYIYAGKKLGEDFVSDPKKLLQKEFAGPILVLGMKEGWFSSPKGKHALPKYVNLTQSDFRNARRGVNGMDKADLIAGYAKEYDELLLKEGYGVTPPKPELKPEAPVKEPIRNDPVETPVKTGKPSALAVLISAIIMGGVAAWSWLMSIPCDLLGVFCK